MSLPSTLMQQATWQYDLAKCELESGLPEKAAEHFTSALTLAPDLITRPIAAYYLEKMGKPVPPPSKRESWTPGPKTPAAGPTARPDMLAPPIPVQPGAAGAAVHPSPGDSPSPAPPSSGTGEPAKTGAPKPPSP